MKFNYLQALFALSDALDCVERDLIGVSTHHSKRVAYMACAMGKALGLSDQQLMDLAACTLLHDNALTEYIRAEALRSGMERPKVIDVKAHCVLGERNAEKMLFYGDVKGVILCHHENADGTGPLGRTLEQTPLYARLIHLCDQIDAAFDVSALTEHKRTAIREYLLSNSGTRFDADSVQLFLSGFKDAPAETFLPENLSISIRAMLPATTMDCAPEQMIGFASVFAAITDYKSRSTRNHSLGIAQKAMVLAQREGANQETCAKLYLAGALHDIGKLMVDRNVLEKPDTLTASEYRHIQTHAHYTKQILSSIEGLEDIALWASSHHEKLDGSGYPSGKTAAELTHNERLLACLDIYQALTEPRPYKAGMDHQRAMRILDQMAAGGKLDASIVREIDKAFR